MTDIVTVRTETAFKAFQTPKYARYAIPQEGGEFTEGDGIAVEFLPPEALDALASQWLDHLYARCSRQSPFKLIGGANG